MSQQYAPTITWICDECGAAGELSIPPAAYAEGAMEVASRAHALVDAVCAAQWGARFVRVSQGEYPD